MEEGIEIGSVAGYHAIITITPLDGFTATASDFSAVNPNSTYVNAITFTQDGDNVLCNIYLVQGVTMPSNDITISICVTGGGVGKDIKIYKLLATAVFTIWIINGALSVIVLFVTRKFVNKVLEVVT